MRSEEEQLVSSSSSSSMAAIELIVLYARMKNAEHKMAPPSPSALTPVVSGQKSHRGGNDGVQTEFEKCFWRMR